MKCPDCQMQLDVVSCKGVLIHECLACKGKWFEHQELKRVRDKADEGLRWLDFDPFDKDLPHEPASSGDKHCPGCQQNLKGQRYDNSRVILHKCNDCRGVWLSSGELIRMIHYLEDLVNAQKTGSLALTTFKKFIEVLTGPKGAGEELKDLWAVLYILEVKVGVDHPHLAAVTRRLYEFAPYL